MKISLFSFLVFFLFLIPGRSNGQCMGSWSYYMPITVKNNTYMDLQEYQTKIIVNTANLIAEGYMKQDCSDIRFVDSGSCQPMPYWIESGIDSSATVIWVKMPVLPGNATRTIKMYYGNEAAKPASNGDSTFLIFDDFSEHSLNSKKWSLYSHGGNYGFYNTSIWLDLTTSGNTDGETLISSDSFPSNLILEDKVLSVSNGMPALAIMKPGVNEGYGSFGEITGSTFSSYPRNCMGPLISKYSIFGVTPTVKDSTNPYSYTLAGIYQLAWISTSWQYFGWPGGSDNGDLTDYAWPEYVQVGFGLPIGSTGSTSVDWIRARVYAQEEPTVKIGYQSNNYIINTWSIKGSPFCVGQSFKVLFAASGISLFNADNVFTVQMSDSSGSFANPTDIGTLKSQTSTSINAIIPKYSVGKFLIRVTSSDPAITGYVSPSAIDVPAAPVASYYSPSAFECYGVAFNFKNTSSNAVSYKWNFGDGGTSTEASPNYTFNTDGGHTVSLIALNAIGCRDTAGSVVAVYPRIFPSISVNNPVQCFNSQDFDFSNTSYVNSGSFHSSWNLGDTSFRSDALDFQHAYKVPGSYLVKLVAISDKGCKDSTTDSITIHPAPVAILLLQGPDTVCQNMSVSLFDSSPLQGYDYIWLNNGVILPGEPYYYIMAFKSGIYRLIVKDNNGCSDTSNAISATVNPLPAKPQIVQTGRVLSTNKASSYQWELNGHYVGGGTSQDLLPNVKRGTYTVTITDSNGCSNSSETYTYDVSAVQDMTTSASITIYPNPAHSFVDIDLSAVAGVYDILEIEDMNGRQIKTVNLVGGNGIIEIKTDEIARGIYVLKLTGKSGAMVSKVLLN